MPLLLNNRFYDIRQLCNRRILAVFLLGFSSGLPLALCGSTLQAWYTVSGVDLKTIGFLSLVGMPYVYKFLWAPLMDYIVPPFLDRRRGWMLIMQVMLIIGLILMSYGNPLQHPWTLGLLALAIAFSSASQDIAINAYTTDVLLPEERGMGAAVTVYGYRIAMLVSGWIALEVASRFGWQVSYLLMAACMAIGVFTSFISPAIPVERAPVNLISSFIRPLKELLKRKGIWFIAFFIVLYKLGDVFALSLTTTFLIRALHFTLHDVGVINKLMSLLGSILGILLGGLLLTRFSLKAGLWWFGLLQATTNLLFMALAMVGHVFWFACTTVFMENFCAGLGTAAFVAFIMHLCDKRFTATQYAVLSALSVVGRTFVGPFAAILVQHFGWTQFYGLTFLFALPGLGVLLFLSI